MAHRAPCRKQILSASVVQTNQLVQRRVHEHFCRAPEAQSGVVNLLIWYDSHVKHDQRIVDALRKFDRLLLAPGQRKRRCGHLAYRTRACGYPLTRSRFQMVTLPEDFT